jgi:phosphoenolpyruvate carboxylase
MSPALVLATVDAPHSEQLDAQQLAYYLKNQAAAKAVPGHMSVFFGEVDPALQVGFASLFEITKPELVAAAKAFAQYSGESYPLAA